MCSQDHRKLMKAVHQADSSGLTAKPGVQGISDDDSGEKNQRNMKIVAHR